MSGFAGFQVNEVCVSGSVWGRSANPRGSSRCSCMHKPEGLYTQGVVIRPHNPGEQRYPLKALSHETR